MSNVTQLVIETPLLRQAKNITISMINLSLKPCATLEEAQAVFRAIELLARESHDLIVDAEFEQQGKPKKGGGF